MSKNVRVSIISSLIEISVCIQRLALRIGQNMKDTDLVGEFQALNAQLDRVSSELDAKNQQLATKDQQLTEAQTQITDLQNQIANAELPAEVVDSLTQTKQKVQDIDIKAGS